MNRVATLLAMVDLRIARIPPRSSISKLLVFPEFNASRVCNTVEELARSASPKSELPRVDQIFTPPRLDGTTSGFRPEPFWEI